MPLHMYVTRCMCGGPTGSMPNVRPVSTTSQVYHNPSSGVGSIQASNTQGVAYQGNIHSFFRFLTTTIHGPSQETENVVCLSSSTGDVI